MTSSKLPLIQDIVDTVIDKLEDDARTLRSLSLVSYACAYHAQSKLFSCISLSVYHNEIPASLTRLVDIVQSNAHIAQSVRCVHLSGGKRRSPSAYSRLVDVAEIFPFALFPNMRSVRISDSQVARFTDVLPLMSHLSHVETFTFDHVIACWQGNSDMTSSWSPRILNSHIGADHTGFFALKSLQWIDDTTSVLPRPEAYSAQHAALAYALAQAGGHRGLESLHIISLPECWRAWTSYFMTMGHSLQDCTICVPGILQGEAAQRAEEKRSFLRFCLQCMILQSLISVSSYRSTHASSLRHTSGAHIPPFTQDSRRFTRVHFSTLLTHTGLSVLPRCPHCFHTWRYFSPTSVGACRTPRDAED